MEEEYRNNSDENVSVETVIFLYWVLLTGHSALHFSTDDAFNPYRSFLEAQTSNVITYIFALSLIRSLFSHLRNGSSEVLFLKFSWELCETMEPRALSTVSVADRTFPESCIHVGDFYRHMSFVSCPRASRTCPAPYTVVFVTPPRRLCHRRWFPSC